VGAPDTLSRGFYHSYQIVFTILNTSTGKGFTKVNQVDLHTFQGINPNFRVGQLSDFGNFKVEFFMLFEQK
jgi:hypothetical protein